MEETWISGDLPRSGRSTKITPRAQRRLIQEVMKEPRTASKELQASLKTSVRDSIIRKRRHPWETSKIEPQLTKNNTKDRLTFTKKYLDYPQDFWSNIQWTDKTKLFGRCSRYIWHKTNTAFDKRASYQQSTWRWWWCDGLGLQDLMETWTQHMSGGQCVSSSSNALGLCSRTMIPNTPASPPLNASRQTKVWIISEWDAVKLSTRKPSNVADLKQFCKEERAKLTPQRCERLMARYHKRSIAVAAEKWHKIDFFT